jgi:hypothetical protein
MYTYMEASMSLNLKAFIFSNKLEHSTEEQSKWIAYRMEAQNRGWGYVEATEFPPKGFNFIEGKLTPKTEQEKVDSGELSLTAIVESKCSEIERLAAQKITNGIASSALGTPHMYPSTEVDQKNLMAKVIAGVDDYFKCKNLSTGITDFYPHTIEQFKAAFSDGDKKITTILKKSAALQYSVRQLPTYEAVSNFDINSGW